MALRLQIISDQRNSLGEHARAVFGVGGGSIGRAHDNDWVLPDAQRYVSSHHARIHCRDGRYYLQDTSSNGVYVNGATTPIGVRAQHELRDGEDLRMGDYHLRVRIDATLADTDIKVAGSLSASLVAVDVVTPLRTPDTAPPVAGSLESWDSLNLEDLLLSDGAASGPEDRLQRARAAARDRLDGRVPSAHDVRAGLQTFCRGAGIDAASLPPEAEARMLLLAGQLLREAVLGLQDIVRVQRDFQHQHQITAPKPEREGPAPDSLAANDYLLRLLKGHESRELDALMLLRSAFATAKGHDAALRPALGEAVHAFMKHLDPDGIAARTTARGSDSNACWDVYGDLYRNLMQTPEGQPPHLFAESLAQAYLKSLKTADTPD